MSTLYDKLSEYAASDYYGFHMPGHKRNTGLMEEDLPFEIDISEIDGFDDLHHAQGILKDAQERASRVWHADETHFLVNGSTVGILSAIWGTARKGDSVVVARNCHKSVYNALEMGGLTPTYVYPGYDEASGLCTGITVEAVHEALHREPRAKAVILTSPTYDGVVSDIAGIAEEAHARDIPLIVDEAHGAHFGFHPFFPKNANQLGADLVIHSLHKTLPALTQTALLHINGDLVNREKVVSYLDRLQTSSPSYVLMASIDSVTALLEREKTALFDGYAARLEALRQSLANLSHLRLVQPDPAAGAFDYDRSKLVISVRGSGISSQKLYKQLLQEFHLQMEMAAGTYVLGMTSIADTQEGFDRLAEALFSIDEGLLPRDDARINGNEAVPGEPPRAAVAYPSWQMDQLLSTGAGRVESIPLEESIGNISAEYAYLYPPGSPLLVPGERITRPVVEQLGWYEKQGFSVEGLKEPGRIEVWNNG